MKGRNEGAIQETLELAGKMNGLVRELLSLTERLKAALSAQDLNASAEALDLRQGILDSAANLRELISGKLDSSYDGVPLPEEIAAVLEDNRRTLQNVHEMEAECMALASGYRDEIKDRLGQVRAVRKMKVYNKGGGQGRTAAAKLFKKKV
ncbi:MAG: hypothetical protein HY788_12035 [Deltaproteobacteria bacterium]|nr:hypothetical protein [Deltaproteobacteria bacterium]